MATAADIEAVIPGAQGRILGALMRLDGPRTISDVARLADVSRDRAADVVAELERIGLVERRRVGRGHLISLIEENPVTESLREIERVHERSVDRLRRVARSIRPKPQFMVLYGSWARQEATAESDLDVAVIADPDADRDALLEALDRWSVVARRVTGHNPSVVIADDRAAARGQLWNSIRRDAVVLVDADGDDRGA
jgi:predicted nucleotidyltransferase